jgi:hypothetical protein
MSNMLTTVLISVVAENYGTSGQKMLQIQDLKPTPSLQFSDKGNSCLYC